MTTPTSPQQTDLELAIIGTVWRLGPCSAYVVQKEFAASPTIRWSSSTGSIYPALARLERSGLLRAEERPWGSSIRKLFAVSAAGRTELTNWIANIRGAAGPSYDAIRTRFFFLDVLENSEDRLRVVRNAIHETQREIGKMESLAREAQGLGVIPRLAVEGGLMELSARLAWLHHIDRELEAQGAATL